MKLDKDVRILINVIVTFLIAFFIGSKITDIIHVKMGWNTSILDFIFFLEREEDILSFILSTWVLIVVISILGWTIWAVLRKKISRIIFFYSVLIFTASIFNGESEDFGFGICGVLGVFLSLICKIVTGFEGIDIVSLIKEDYDKAED